MKPDADDRADIERRHRLDVLTGSSRYGVGWRCLCGAEGQGNGSAVVGWATHVSDIILTGAAG